MSDFDVRALDVPIVLAPMAGGPSTPALAAAVSSAGGLGFLAAGYLSADTLAERVRAARAATTGPLGVNLFVPAPSVAVDDEVRRYAASLAPEAARYGVDLAAVDLAVAHVDDDAWPAKLEVVLDLRPEVVSFTFAVPDPGVVGRLKAAGTYTAATVTTAAEARHAVAAGVDALVAQGPGAGGHRGTLDPAAAPATQPLDRLVAELTATTGLPVLAAGGLSGAGDVAAVRAVGAVAAVLGTAFLLADESGSSPVHRGALADPDAPDTVVTRCFSGRYARGLRNRFVQQHDADAPLGYPDLHYLTSPVRAAAVRAGDSSAVNVWAGVGFRSARAVPAAQIVAALV